MNSAKAILISMLVIFTVAQGQDNTSSITIQSKHLSPDDTLELYIWRDLIGGEYQAPYDSIRLVIDSMGQCRAIIPNVGNHTYVSLNLSYQKKKGIPSNGIFKLMQVVSGDDIDIKLHPAAGRYRPLGGGYDNGEPVFVNNWNCQFTGVGSKRMMLQYQIANLFVSLGGSYVIELSTAEKVKAEWTAIEYARNRAMKEVTNNLGCLSAFDVEQLEQEITAWWFYSSTKMLEKYKGWGTKEICKSGNLEVLQVQEALVTELKLLSNQTLEALAYKQKILEACVLLVELENVDEKDSFVFSNIIENAYKLISNKKLRDRVITNLFINRYAQNPRKDILNNALTTIEDQYALSRLRMLDIFAPGSIFPDFSFPDLTRTYHNLSDYGGQLILVDFWYMACIPCRIFLEKELAPLMNIYARDEEIKVILVSLDDSKVLAKAASNGIIPEGVLNLYTDNQKFQHPYLKKIALNSYPFPILLDTEGKVIMAGAELKGKNLIDLIEKYKNSGD